METSKVEYEVTCQYARNANCEGAPYDTLEEALQAFDYECAHPDPNQSKIVELNENRCWYDESGECVDVQYLNTIKSMRV